MELDKYKIGRIKAKDSLDKGVDKKEQRSKLDEKIYPKKEIDNEKIFEMRIKRIIDMLSDDDPRKAQYIKMLEQHKEMLNRDKSKKLNDKNVTPTNKVDEIVEQHPSLTDPEGKIDEKGPNTGNGKKLKASFDTTKKMNADQLRPIFEEWSEKMDELYQGETRHDAASWDKGSPSDWMEPFDQNIFDAFNAFDTGDPMWKEKLSASIKADDENEESMFPWGDKVGVSKKVKADKNINKNTMDAIVFFMGFTHSIDIRKTIRKTMPYSNVEELAMGLPRVYRDDKDVDWGYVAEYLINSDSGWNLDDKIVKSSTKIKSFEVFKEKFTKEDKERLINSVINLGFEAMAEEIDKFEEKNKVQFDYEDNSELNGIFKTALDGIKDKFGIKASTKVKSDDDEEEEEEKKEPKEKKESTMDVFDVSEGLPLGDGAMAHKDEDTGEIYVIDKNGNELVRTVNAFVNDMGLVIEFYRDLLGLSDNNEKVESAEVATPIIKDEDEDVEEEPSEENVPALDESSEQDDLSKKLDELINVQKEQTEILKEQTGNTSKEENKEELPDKSEEKMLNLEYEIQEKKNKVKSAIQYMIENDKIKVTPEEINASKIKGESIIFAKQRAKEIKMTELTSKLFNSSDEMIDMYIEAQTANDNNEADSIFEQLFK